MQSFAPDGSEYLSSQIYESNVTARLGSFAYHRDFGIEGSILSGSTTTTITLSDYTDQSFVSPVCSLTGRGLNGAQRTFYVQSKTNSSITVGINRSYREDLYFDLLVVEKY